MSLFADAIAFAVQVHDGALRKGTNTPYIVHPMETAAIAATLTDDPEVLAAAVLHDVIEDCGVTAQALCGRFGERVARIVLSESQMVDGDPCQSWERRKRGAIERLRHADRAQMIVALSDKLSNMRAISRDYARFGEALFARFHQQDKRLHAWYYRSCAALLRRELGDTDAFAELTRLIAQVFAACAPEDALYDTNDATEVKACAV
ncbi:MAG: HD domain-containing protein [Candidatus Ventricola sp.]